MNTPKIAIVVHCFYVEQLEAIIGFLENIPHESDLYVSSVAEISLAVRALLEKAFPKKKTAFRTVQNRGFDIASFVCEFRDVYPAYDLVLKIHTKKSSQTSWLKEWGSYLLENVAGTPATVSLILKMFAEDKALGLVYPEIIPPLKQVLMKDPWQENWGICQKLASQLGILIRKEMSLDFPAGSMFWFRPKALELLFKLGLMPDDFPGGSSIRRNGTLAHAVERMLVLIVGKAGFSSHAVCFEPYKIVRDMSFSGRLKNRASCEWRRFLDFLGNHL